MSLQANDGQKLEPDPLYRERSAILHSLMSNFSFLAKQGLPDIQGEVAFLSTSVKDANDDDYMKQGSLVCHLCCTKV